MSGLRDALLYGDLLQRQAASELAANGSLVIPETYFVKGDGSTDDLTHLQNAVNAISTKFGGGILQLGPKTYRVSGPLLLPTNVKLRGCGPTLTFIKPTNSATFTSSQAVVMTSGFVQDQNLWNYYSPYPSGIQMGVGLEDLTIDGNTTNVANANGLMLYGGKWKLTRIGVINTAGHGIWTECGVPGSSTLGTGLDWFINMHESVATDVFISNTGKRGWWYRGPNDSYIDRVQIKMAGWSSFYMDADSSTVATSGLKIGTLHCYPGAQSVSDPDNVQVYLGGQAFWNLIYIDTPNKDGLIVAGAKSKGLMTNVYKHNSTGAGAYWAVRLTGPSNTLVAVETNMPTARSGTTHGGSLRVENADNTVRRIEIDENSSNTIDFAPIVLQNGVNGSEVFGVVRNCGGITYGARLQSAGCTIDVKLESCGSANVFYENITYSALNGNDITVRIAGSGTGSILTQQSLNTRDLATVVNSGIARRVQPVLDFSTSRTATYNSGTSTLTLNGTFSDYAPSSPTTVTTLSQGIGQWPWVVITNTGSSTLSFTHNASTLRLKGQTTLTLQPNETAMFCQRGAGGAYQQIT